MLRQTWQIALLGGIEARQGPLVVSKFSTRHAALLFAYLAHQLGREASRDSLVEMLWPDSDVDTGRNRLRVALASIRRQLEPPGTRPGSVLSADRSMVALNAEACSVDSVVFRRLVEGAHSEFSRQRATDQLLEADELYKGSFCNGLEADWILDERNSLTDLQVTGQMRLSQILGQSNDFAGAMRQARRAVEADPLSEPARRVAMRVLLGLRDVDAAKLELDEFKRVLKRETGLQPSPETLRLLERVGVEDEEVTRKFDEVETEAATTGATAGSLERLPRFLDRYIDRPDEVSSLESVLGVSRIVTLIGPGGVGKTRLCVELIRAASASYGSGIWFVPVPTGEARPLLELLLELIDPAKSGSDDPLHFIGNALNLAASGNGRNAALIVIDGAEHLQESAPREIVALLRAAPNLTILATSRRRIGIVGEQERYVKPLEVPEIRDTSCLEDLVGSPSVRLFVERARAIQPDFQPNQANAASLAQICGALDGMPLAIELAAARIRKTPLKSMALELVHSETDEETKSWRLAGQRSLKTTLTWSFEALSANDRKSLSMLGIFGASWDLDAAEEILQDSSAQEILERLVENSLIVRVDSPSRRRYRMLSSVRNFAFQKLDVEDAELVAQSHANHYLRRSLRFGVFALHAGSFRQSGLGDEKENIRAALVWHSQHPEKLSEFFSFVTALTWFWTFVGGLAEGRKWLCLVRARIDASDGRRLATLLFNEAILACFLDDAEKAFELSSEAVEFLKDAPDSKEMLEAKWALGFAFFELGRYAESRETLNWTLARMNQIEAAWWVGATHNILGFVECAEGLYDEAESHLIRSREIWHTIGDRNISNFAELGLARVAWRRGNFQLAEQIYQECLRRYRTTGDYRGAAYSVEGLARVSASFERWSLAARLYGAAQRLRDLFGLQIDRTDEAANRELRDLVSSKLGRRFEAECGIGRSLGPEAIWLYAARIS